ncbi:MAG: hypothetical protein RIR95_187 [Pseudomonadota bacterium]
MNGHASAKWLCLSKSWAQPAMRFKNGRFPRNQRQTLFSARMTLYALQKRGPIKGPAVRHFPFSDGQTGKRETYAQWSWA